MMKGDEHCNDYACQDNAAILCRGKIRRKARKLVLGT